MGGLTRTGMALTYPAFFLSDTHTKYLGWALSDRDPQIRTRCLASGTLPYTDAEEHERVFYERVNQELLRNLCAVALALFLIIIPPGVLFCPTCQGPARRTVAVPSTSRPVIIGNFRVPSIPLLTHPISLGGGTGCIFRGDWLETPTDRVRVASGFALDPPPPPVRVVGLGWLKVATWR